MVNVSIDKPTFSDHSSVKKQQTTFEGRNNTHSHYETAEGIISIQRSRMLEPHQQTIDKVGALRDSYRGTHTGRSSIQVGSQRIINTNRPEYKVFSKKESSIQNFRSETSTYSTEYSQKFLNLTTKIQKNNKEIKRIENILYSKKEKSDIKE